MATDKNDRNDHPIEGEDTRQPEHTAPEQPDPTSEFAAEPAADTTVPAAPEHVPADTRPTAVPDSPAELVADPLWEPEDYLGVTGDAAIKLSTSAVAPLVAAARGYRTIEPAGLKNLLAEYSMGAVNSRAGRAFKDAIGFDGALLMPWFSLESVRQAANYHRPAHPVTPQLRPERPPMDDAGRPKKYLFASTAAIPLDIHPDTPTEWVDTAPTVLLAEGLLKGDAALTAILRHHGATMEDLAAPAGGDHSEAMRRLLTQIPDAERVLIVSLGGVGNWHSNPDWNTLNLRDRQAWIAVDGDVGTNWNVWNQVHQMWSLLERKRAVPRLLDLAVAMEDTGGTDMGPVVSKMGLDDYLAQIGTWSSLMPRVLPALPPCPPKESTVAFKDWRMNDAACTAEEYVPNPDVAGVNHPRWETRCAISGRIASVEQRREATPTEIRTGHFDDSPEAEATATAECTIEVSFLDETTGERITRTVSGPASLLSDPPAEWHRRGATLPTEIHTHRDWPPPLQWRGAMKGHRQEKRETRFAWAQMGWVPVQGGHPVYIVGDQVIGTTGFTDAATPGITEHTLSGASRFGVDLPVDLDQARADLRELVEVYYRNGAWADRRLGALVVAAGIRPAVPIRPYTTIYFEGKKAAGKALPLDSRVPVPRRERYPAGWAQVGEIAVGDQVFDAHGCPTRVRELSEVVTDHPVYELTLRTGQVVRATGSHLWKVSTRYSRAAAGRAREHDGGRAVAAARIAGLRELALRSAPGDGATTGDIARLAGVSYAKAWSAINLAAVPSQRVSTPFGSPKACCVWVSDDAVPVLARRGILGATPQAAPFPVPAGSWCTARELAQAMLGAPASRNEVASAKNWLRKEGVATKNVPLAPTRMLNIHPVGEALLAIAASFGTAQEPQPLETLLTTEELAQRVEGDALAIRSAEALQFDDAELPVPPYTLGAWLGDGTSREGGFTSPDEEVLDGIRSDGFVVHTSPTRSIAHYIRGLVPGLRAIDVLNNKHIPALYLRASRAQRLAVLQGLMDADGSINEGGSCELTLCREALATDALELIRSLGIKASINSSPSSITEADPQNPGSTRRRVVGTRWRMHFTTSVPIFRLPRKAERMRVRGDEAVSWLGIEAVRRLPAAPARCLTVEHPSGMFLADGFVPTHNSWSASAIMAFWQANAKGWGEKLPGGAKDTMASTELAVSRANIWVIDDLAPTGDQRQAQAELARLGDLIRSVHNGSGKRRANQNMDLRATHDPRALLIITAENEHNVASVRDRIIFAPVNGLGTDEAVAAVEEMRDVTGIPGRVSGAVIQDLARLTATHGWSQYCGILARVYDRDSRTAADATGDGDKAIRHGRLAADIVLGIRVLGDYAAEIGCKDLRPFIGGMVTDVFSLVADHYVSQKTTSPGRSALAAVRATLSSGQAHIVSLTTPGAPPATGEEAGAINNLLGWTATPDGGSRPGGPSIGWIAYPKGQGVVFLNAIPAFNEARRNHPDLIPYRSTHQAAWKSAWDEGLCSERWTRKKNNGGRQRITVRARGGRAEGEASTWSVEGVPIPLEFLVNAAAAAEPDEENDPEEV